VEQLEIPYQVRLEKFEGPLDLLLHLIRKSEINIYDIPIALITQQYLEYLSLMKSLNLAVAGEFLVMAATLVQIKARMLLPVDETDGDEEDGPDPREELIRRLLEYKQFKEAAGALDHREREWREVFRDTVTRSTIDAFDIIDYDTIDRVYRCPQGLRIAEHQNGVAVDPFLETEATRRLLPERRDRPEIGYVGGNCVLCHGSG